MSRKLATSKASSKRTWKKASTPSPVSELSLPSAACLGLLGQEQHTGSFLATCTSEAHACHTSPQSQSFSAQWSSQGVTEGGERAAGCYPLPSKNGSNSDMRGNGQNQASIYSQERPTQTIQTSPDLFKSTAHNPDLIRGS